jgi:hypothetical protein
VYEQSRDVQVRHHGKGKPPPCTSEACAQTANSLPETTSLSLLSATLSCRRFLHMIESSSNAALPPPPPKPRPPLLARSRRLCCAALTNLAAGGPFTLSGLPVQSLQNAFGDQQDHGGHGAEPQCQTVSGYLCRETAVLNWLLGRSLPTVPFSSRLAMSTLLVF